MERAATSGSGLKVFKHDKHGPMYLKSDLDAVCMDQILSDQFFERRVKTMSDDAKKAIEKTEKVTAEFVTTLGKFMDVERNFIEKSKRASGNIRDASEKLAQGLARVEKAANFDRLERYVTLLERASVAMKTLAELEASGKLEKISGAMR